MSRRDPNLPLVYSCSGCSSAAQMANYIAVKLDRRDERSGRPILALDGCALQCVKNSLAQRGVQPARHVLLGEYGVRKRYRSDFDIAEADRVLEQTVGIARELRAEIESARHPADPLAA